MSNRSTAPTAAQLQQREGQYELQVFSISWGHPPGAALEWTVQIHLRSCSFSSINSHLSSCQNANVYCWKMPGTHNTQDTLLFRMITNVTIEDRSWSLFRCWPGRKQFIFHFDWVLWSHNMPSPYFYYSLNSMWACTYVYTKPAQTDTNSWVLRLCLSLPSKQRLYSSL